MIFFKMRYQLVQVVALLALVNLASAKLYILHTPVNWATAILQCRKLGHRLVVIESAAKQQEIQREVSAQNLDGQYFWTSATSLNDPPASKFYWWPTGRQLVGGYSNWGRNQPDNQDGIEHCMQLRINLEWNDIRCDSLWRPICEEICCGC